MDLKTELVALAIRQLAKRTNLVRRPSNLETLMNELFGLKSYDRQLAEDVIKEAQKAAAAAKRANTDRKFKKIVRNY